MCGNTRLTQFNATPLYAAAEIASPADATRGYLGRPVDMWALGCVVYEMLHRKPAFWSEERFELQNLIRRANHARIDKRVPRDAKELLRGLLCAEPARRLTATQLLRESPWLSEEARAARVSEQRESAAAAADEANAEAARQAMRPFGL